VYCASSNPILYSLEWKQAHLCDNTNDLSCRSPAATDLSLYYALEIALAGEIIQRICNVIPIAFVAPNIEIVFVGIVAGLRLPAGRSLFPLVVGILSTRTNQIGTILSILAMTSVLPRQSSAGSVEHV
jgi:hypothetical protein